MSSRTGFSALVASIFSAPRTGGPRSLRRTLALTLTLPPLVVLQGVHWLAFRLDELLFPGFRTVEVREPLFVLGLPRSGTTSLHHILSRDTERFTTLRLWELLLAPSITERKLWGAVGRIDGAVGGPGRRLLRWLERRLGGFMDDVHPVSLSDPEEDYLFLLHVFACFILVLPFPDHPRIWRLTRQDTADPEEADRVVAFYRACVQRHLYVTGPDRQLLSKNPSFTPLIAALDRAFPDARFIGCLRDPARVIPSQLSSLEDGARFYGWSVADPPYRDRIIQMLRDYATHLLTVLPSLPESRHDFTVLTRLGRDVPGSVQRIYRRFGWTASPAFLEALAEEGERSRRHSSGHRYSLSDYGLDEGSVRTAFRDVSERIHALQGDRA